MRAMDVSVIAVAVAVVGTLCPAMPVSAQTFGIELNGTYRVLSDGEWATRGGPPGGAPVFFDQPKVIETWNVSTSCVSPIECTGTVISDRGYTATIRLDDFWLVDHDIADWVPCPDGTSAPGHQKFILWGFNPPRNERSYTTTDFFIGRNVTKSPSGACGRNQPIVIEMPVRMQRA